MDTFADRLAKLSKDYTASELARKAGLPRATVGRYLKGEREPAFGALLKLAHALGVSLGAFDTGATR